MNKKLLITIATITALLTVFWYFKKPGARLSIQQAQTATQPICANLNKLEEEVWQALSSEKKITKEQVEEMRQKKYSEYKKDHTRPDNGLTLSSATISFVHNIMDEFGVDKKEIILIAQPSMVGAAQVIDDFHMEVNEKNLAKFSPEAQAFIIGHELQHIIFKDHSTAYFIRTLLPEPEKYEPLFAREHPMMQFYRFREERADVMAATRNDIWAHNYAIYAQENLALRGDAAVDWHVRSSKRVVLAQEINNALQTA
ncbi:MAG: hypothetical protein AB7R69_01395 [Candidatus Babeliales bacterium]